MTQAHLTSATPATPAVAATPTATPTPLRVLVTGSRHWADTAAVRDTLTDLHREYGTRLVVLHGACSTGADAIADQWCRERGVPVEAYPADWATHGRGAGHRRNHEMVATRPDLCLAFILNASPGATGCAAAAQAAGIPVRRHEQRSGTVPCRNPWCRGACGFDVDAHIKTHGPGILVTAKVPAERIVNRTRATAAPPVTHVRAPHPPTTPPPVAPAPPGDQPAMNTPTAVDTPADPPADRPVVVTAQPGSRLEALLAEYERVKPLADAAAAQLKTLTDAIKLDATTAAPNAPTVDLTSPVLSTPLRVQAKTSWRLDTKRMKQENPLLYVTYAYQSTAWELRQVPDRPAS